MSSWREALQRPEGPVESWLETLARRLLCGARLMVNGEPHRLVEIEAYYHSPDHPDPFAHRDPLQLESARWYFHKTRGTYRSGSFKGVDLTFGDGKAHGGMLLRGLETPEGQFVDGPSLLVDHLLTRTGKRDIKTLDLSIAGRSAGEADSPLRLEEIDEPERPITLSSRVGLSLKRTSPTHDNVHYLVRHYRYLSEPSRTAKGKVYMVLALIRQGLSDDQIRQRTGCPIATVKRYRADYEEGRTSPIDLTTFGGIELGTRELCLLHGYGASSAS